MKNWQIVGIHSVKEALKRRPKEVHFVALKESKEESGFDHFDLVDESIFDLDIHEIPAISKDPKHFHYDVRFLLEADPRKNNIIVSEESHDVQWIPLNEVLDMNSESSMQRMVKKTYGLAR